MMKAMVYKGATKALVGSDLHSWCFSLGTDSRRLSITFCCHLLLSFGIASGVTPSSIRFGG